MSAARPAHTVPTGGSRESAATYPASGRRPTSRAYHAADCSIVDPLEEALLARASCALRTLDPSVRDILRLLAEGDDAGAIAAANRLAAGRPVPAVTVSFDVLDEIELDECAVLVLAHIDGRTDLSRVLNGCELPFAEGLRTVCALIERRIVVLRPAG
jgi:hypothetical protein